MTLSSNASNAPAHQSTKLPKQKFRVSRTKKPDMELVQDFWSAPMEAFFNQETVAPVTNKSIKTLESERWRGTGIPYRKMGGRVLYQKKDVTKWLESHVLVISTSEYSSGSDE